MWTTRGLRIVPFLETFIRIARADDYEYIILLIARPADDYLLYENLFRDWTSIHHLTGSEIMFLFVGPNTASEMKPAGFLAPNQQREEELCFSPYVAAYDAPKHPMRFRHSERMINGYDYARLTEHVASLREFDEIVNSHEAQVKELRKRFSLAEAELPALVLLSLKDYRELPISIRGVASLYGLLKALVDEIEKLAQLKNRLQDVNRELHRLRKLPQYKFSANRQQALDALLESSQPPAKVLKALQAMLEEPLPWDRKLKSAMLKSLLYMIKADTDAAWYYHKHRGKIQSLIYSLEVADDTNDSNSFAVRQSELTELMNEQENLKNEIAEICNELLARALQNYLQDEYRASRDILEGSVEPPDVFISYSRADIDKASALEERLRKSGLNVWRDDAIRAGYSFRAEIRAALLLARSVVVLWTINSIKSEWVEWEASMAHRRKRLIPLSDGTVSEHHLPAPFGNLQMVNLHEQDKLLASIQRTIAIRPS